MNTLPAPALHLFGCCAGVLVPTIVVPLDVTVGPRDPDQLGDLVYDCAKPQFALAKHELRSFSIVNIFTDRHKITWLAIGTTHQRDRQVDPNRCLVWQQTTPLNRKTFDFVSK